MGFALWWATSVLLATGCSAASTGAQEPAARPGVEAAAVATPAPSQVRAQRPRVLELPSGARLDVRVGTTDRSGTLSLPSRLDQASWWQGSSRLGDPYGAVVIAAHVDSIAEGIGPIAEILSAPPGARLRVRARTVVAEYRVVSTRFVPRTDLSTHAALLSGSGERRLVLITCGGPYDASYGGYRDNVVVVARQDRLRSR